MQNPAIEPLSAAANFVLQSSLLNARLSKKIGNRLSIHGISLSEYILLTQLASGRELARIELAETLGMSASGITRMLQPLEKNGIVESVKNPRDSRQSLVRLTASGQQLWQDAAASFSSKCADVTVQLSDSQLERITELMVKIAG